jgi:hypothetical protein
MGVISKRLRNSARGQPCTLRLFCCNRDIETTVLAHLPSKVAGMGTKSDDWHAVFACHDCHAELDNRRYMINWRDVLNALQETQKYWFDNGYLHVNDKPRGRQ